MITYDLRCFQLTNILHIIIFISFSSFIFQENFFHFKENADKTATKKNNSLVKKPKINGNFYLSFSNTSVHSHCTQKRERKLALILVIFRQLFSLFLTPQPHFSETQITEAFLRHRICAYSMVLNSTLKRIAIPKRFHANRLLSW